MRRWWVPVLLAGLLGATAGCASPDGVPAVPAQSAATRQVTRPGTEAGKPAEREQPLSTAAVERIPAEWVPKVEEVVTVHLSLGMPVPLEEAPQPLYTTHPYHRATIAYLLDMLADARLAAGEISLPSRAPALQVALRNGASVSARLAYDCTPFTSETGHGYTCRQAPGEVILRTLQGREVRVANPGLAHWLTTQWKDDIHRGTAPDLDKETALQIARETDPKAAWQAIFYEEYPVESKGGTLVRRAWLVEAEHPTGNKTRLVIDALSGEVLRKMQLESLE